MATHHFGRTRADAALSSAERADARAALSLLSGSGLSLADAARRALAGRSALERITVEACVERFLHARLGSCREQTWSWYEVRLGAVRAAFGDRPMDAVTRAEFRAWIAALPVSASTRGGYVRAARALWRWAAAQEPPLAGPPPTSGMVSTASTKGRTVGFLTVPEVAALLGAAHEWRAALALMLFAGLRVDEVAGMAKPPLTWRAIDVVGKTLHVPAEVAKTGRARLLQGLPPALWAWLGTPGPDGARLCPGRSGSAVLWAKKQLPRPWPTNALRHTFATYAVALTGEPDRVAGWLGHEGGARLLHAHYAGLARRAEAEAFFALRPPTEGHKKAPVA
jgi:integrase